ncbi:MAG: RNA-guided pseudouridylation complex pseudouridine synthase subunit Cbf5 [Candidatus Undinarchaeales archaeon]
MTSLPFEKDRDFIVKREEPVSEEHGCRPEKREIEEYLKKGIVNVDKPPGPTSAQVSEFVKKILKIKKAGHSGTLDPGVSGVFPVGISEGTKVLNTLLSAGKEYVALMHLHENATKNEIINVLDEFTGKLFQRPPVRSAVNRDLRIREIYYIDLLEIKGKNVLFKVGCEAGTYIRRLCHDIGLVLGTGAHMQQLRRTKVGAFQDRNAVILQKLTDAYHFWKEDGDEKYLREYVLPMEAGLAHLPKIIISDSAVNSVCHGAQLAVPGILKFETKINKGDLVAVFTQKGEAVLYGKSKMPSKEIKSSEKGRAVETERVLMDADTYPKFS